MSRVIRFLALVPVDLFIQVHFHLFFSLPLAPESLS